MKAETTESTPDVAGGLDTRHEEQVNAAAISSDGADYEPQDGIAALDADNTLTSPESITEPIDITQLVSSHPASGPLPLDFDRKPTLLDKVRTIVPNIGLDDRAGRILLSILLAFLLWFYVVNLENPSQTTVFNDLTVDVRGLSKGLKLNNTIGPIDITVQAPQNALTGLRPADVHAYIDLTGVPAGVHTLPIRVEVQNPQANSISVTTNPNSAQVQLEIESTRDFPVEVRITGTPALGYGADAAQADPSTVRITGAQDLVGRVSKVVATVNIDAQGGTQRGSRVPVALDENGNEITGLTFTPVRVQVVVPIKLLLNYKVVGVSAVTRGQPAPGYRVSAITTDPNTVTVCCDPAILNNIKFLDTLQVPITGTTTDIITQTQLLLPQDVELYPGQTKVISVTIRVEPLVTTLQVSVASTVQGAPEGAGVVVSPDRVSLTLAGTFDQLQGLKPTDVAAVVDVTGKGPGTYDLQPQVTVPQGVKLETSSPASLTVTIIAPTPIPTNTATPQPTSTPQPSPTRQPTSTPLASPSVLTGISTPTVAPASSTSTATPAVPATSTSSPTAEPLPSATTPTLAAPHPTPTP